MNIFVLSEDPTRSAQYHCDKHVVKMVLESCQMLCTTLHTEQIHDVPYKVAHINHPCTKWVRQSLNNYFWLLDLTKELLRQYTLRYGKVHKSTRVYNFCRLNVPLLPIIGLTEFALAMPDEYKVSENPVECYRTFYHYEKRRFARWDKLSNTPEWWEINSNERGN